jgi:hypothetical protein
MASNASYSKIGGDLRQARARVFGGH